MFRLVSLKCKEKFEMCVYSEVNVRPTLRKDNLELEGSFYLKKLYALCDKYHVLEKNKLDTNRRKHCTSDFV